ncbi:MAG: tRNA (adenosine(37)-N6)-dimethylallyltransferase MiaA [Prevotellaceae bacterium]|nr:tRNA (adenosine(37)-N6)-dimethylallyltransferase MiaA [Prevotellaceae bacterium]
MKTLVVILGPTGVGKTAVSVQMARMLHCPILNCDSRQLFQGLEIGTATPTAEQLGSAEHYFVGSLDIDEYYSAARYEADALVLLSRLFTKYDRVILSGGSMLYIDAVCQGIDDIPTVDPATRSLIKQRLAREGLESLVADLEKRDPEYAAIVDRKNTRRVVHALEICEMTDRTYTSFRTRSQKRRPFSVLKIGLNRPREELFDCINKRVDEMMKAGFLDEVRRMVPHRQANALNTVGYKELLRVIDGEWELPMAVERIKKNTRVYAKKQLTWFAKDKDIHWFHPSQIDAIKTLILTYPS